MKLDQASAIAERIRAGLAPHCDRCEIAGSIRRRKREVGDIEIVTIPKTVICPDLFSTADFGETRRSKDWIRAAYLIGDVIKGHPVDGKYIQFLTDEGIMVDLFLATPANWGLIFAVRTGSADYSHRVLACGWVRNGYHGVDGMLMSDGVAVPVREERDLFRMAGVPWVEPEARNL